MGLRSSNKGYRGMLCLGKQESNDRKLLATNETPNLKEKKVIREKIFELVIQFTFNVPFELNFG